MYELKVAVGKVLGTCTADPPMKRGDSFTVRDGDLTIPDGGYICLWALQSLLPLITPKERELGDSKDDDWMWRVHHAQCPDPKGRVVFKVERVATLDKRALAIERAGRAAAAPGAGDAADAPDEAGVAAAGTAGGGNGAVRDLRVVVERVSGKCTSQMHPGDYFTLRAGRVYIPHGRHFCLYALHAALPLLPAKQRSSHAGDWLADDQHVICPDPAGNVVMRIETAPPPDRDVA
jgi:uncharacterized repeat protein (TIGR04076 family)